MKWVIEGMERWSFIRGWSSYLTTKRLWSSYAFHIHPLMEELAGLVVFSFFVSLVTDWMVPLITICLWLSPYLILLLSFEIAGGFDKWDKKGPVLDLSLWFNVRKHLLNGASSLPSVLIATFYFFYLESCLVSQVFTEAILHWLWR